MNSKQKALVKQVNYVKNNCVRYLQQGSHQTIQIHHPIAYPVNPFLELNINVKQRRTSILVRHQNYKSKQNVK